MEAKMNSQLPDRIKAVFVEPGKRSEIIELDSTHEALQSTIGGPIAIYGNFSAPMCICINAESKQKGLPVNRVITDTNGNLLDAICGSFIICNHAGDNFLNTPDDILNNYVKMLDEDKAYFKLNGKIIALKEPNMAKRGGE